MMIEILCTVSGILAGSAVVASVMHHHGGRRRLDLREGDMTTAEESARLQGIADQLQFLTRRVVGDVLAHSEKVTHLNEQLRPAINEPEVILSAIGELLEANEAMHSQLAEAQELLSQQSRQIELTTHEARTDSLTGLANRRALDEFLSTCIPPVVRDEVSGLMMLDIDHFKRCNDNYGHATGDMVLSAFARCIAQWCEGKCYAARFGGEEFAVILRGKTIAAIALDAASLRAAISDKPIDIDGVQLTFTCSGGLVELLPGDSIQEAYKRADIGLYMAKENGRNCGYWFSSGEWVRFASDEVLAAQGQAAGVSEPPDSIRLPAGLSEAVVPPNADRADLQSESTGAGSGRPAMDDQPGSADQTLAVQDHGEDNRADDILDREQFSQRIEVHLAQLHRAELPGTAAMLRASISGSLTSALSEQCWANALAIVQLHVRGIDVICRLSADTFCIFMPGSVLNAAVERAGQMQQELVNCHREPTLPGPLPDRFAIALATAQPAESTEALMKRLEAGLGMASHAKPNEIVVHDGSTCKFQVL